MLKVTFGHQWDECPAWVLQPKQRQQGDGFQRCVSKVCPKGMFAIFCHEILEYSGCFGNIVWFFGKSKVTVTNSMFLCFKEFELRTFHQISPLFPFIVALALQQQFNVHDFTPLVVVLHAGTPLIRSVEKENIHSSISKGVEKEMVRTHSSLKEEFLRDLSSNTPNQDMFEMM